MRKQQVLATVDALPDEFLAEELIERLIFMEKVDKGMRDAEEGRTITLQEAKERLDRKWQK
jgi:predicted transcriptional regulator